MFVIALIVNGKEKYMRELSGDDCFTDDIGDAIMYEFSGDIPPLKDNEFIIEGKEDGKGWIHTGK